MNSKILSSLAAAAMLAGCMTVNKPKTLEGNWGMLLPFESMNAGHMIVKGNRATILWRWASPIEMPISIDGNKFKVEHPWNFKLEGEFVGDNLTAKVTDKKGKDLGVVTGWRNPCIKPADTADIKLGEPIDLLKDGLDGWYSMNEKAPFCWSFDKKNGILSNKLNGSHGAANIMSKRADFYDFNLEYDVRVPKGANSGVYLRGRYEIQTVDSYGKDVDCHNMAAYYGRVTPLKAVEKKPGEWQHVSVTLYKRHLTVILNGTKIIDNAPVVGITGGAIDAKEFVPGPLYLQGDHSDADYKNMILRPAVN